jgi:hypothetical protein
MPQRWYSRLAYEYRGLDHKAKVRWWLVWAAVAAFITFVALVLILGGNGGEPRFP